MRSLQALADLSIVRLDSKLYNAYIACTNQSLFAMERIRWIDHKGTKILMLDYSGLLEEKFVLYIEKACEFQVQQVRGKVLVVCDVTGTRSTPRVLRASRQANKTLIENGIQQKLATIGLNRMQRVIANAIKSDMYFASDFNDAVEWLCSDKT